MIFVHSADLHLGAHKTLKVSVEEKLLRCSGYMSEIFRIAKQEKAHAVVLAGDIFDSPYVSFRERDILLKVLIENVDMPVIMINGNHDMVDKKHTALNAFALLQQALPNLHVAEIVPKNVVIAGVMFAMIPFTGSQSTFDKAVLSAKNNHYPTVVVGHELVRNSRTDSGRVFSRGIVLKHSPDVLYWAMGDIHKTQQLLDNAWYPGSPAQHRADESPERGVLVVDTDRPTAPRFVRIVHPDVKIIRTFSVKSKKDIPESMPSGWNIVNCANAQLFHALPKEGIVRRSIVYEDNVAAKATDTTVGTGPMDLLYRWLIDKRSYSKMAAADAIKTVQGLLQSKET